MGIGAQADDEGDELINADKQKQKLLERKDWRSRRVAHLDWFEALIPEFVNQTRYFFPFSANVTFTH